MNNLPFASVLVPCRNEADFIGKCLASLAASDYPKDRLEVLVVDGMSEDHTRGIVEGYAKRHAFIRLLDNPGRITARAFNIGIASARGDVVMLMGAHALYPTDYISKCVRFLIEYRADNVGGAMITLPGGDSLMAKCIAAALSHPFGAGNSYFRVGGSTAPRWVDTVFGGCYRRDVFDKVGLFNENLARSQDMDFNLRLTKAGGKILMVPEIVCHYYARPKLGPQFRHDLADGVWAIRPLKFGSPLFRFRHLVPLAFVSGLLGSLALGMFCKYLLWLFFLICASYLCANVYFSARIAVARKDVRYLFTMPIVFAARHIGYGMGSIWGLLGMLMPVRERRSQVAARGDANNV